MKTIVLLMMLCATMDASAGNCYCQNTSGQNKTVCQSTPGQCAAYCNEMNPHGRQDQIAAMSFNAGTCFAGPMSGDPSVVRVDAQPVGYWTETSIDVKDGQRYIVTVGENAGVWHTNPYWTARLGLGSSTYTAGPTYLLPGAPEGALIGKVGVNGAPFYIGNGALTPSEASGKLFLTTNDEPKGFGDNSGWLWVNIYPR